MAVTVLCVPSSLDSGTCEAGSCLRLIDFVYHSTLGSRVMKKRKKTCESTASGYEPASAPASVRLCGLNPLPTEGAGAPAPWLSKAKVTFAFESHASPPVAHKCAAIPRRARI